MKSPEPFDALREAYVADLIDLETFERFRALEVAGEPFIPPLEVVNLAARSRLTDAPGGLRYVGWGSGLTG